MKSKMKKILIIIILVLIVILSSIIVYNIFFKTPNETEKPKDKMVEVVVTGETQEEILDFLQQEFNEDGTKLELLEENEEEWIFSNTRIEDNKMLKIIVVNKKTKGIIVNTIASSEE